MLGQILETFFAPAERESNENVMKVSNQLKDEFLLDWFDAIPASVMVLNEFRQIVYCNESFRNLSLKKKMVDLIGMRPGEALDCVHSREVAAGCGCSEHCSTCGAAQAIVKSLEGNNDCQTCRLLRLVNDVESHLDLQVFTKPIEFRGEKFILMFAMDISHELRLRYLNQTFQHGVINSAGSIATLTELIEAQPEDNNLFPLLIDTSRRVLRDALYHHDLSAAEQNKLRISKEPFQPDEFFRNLVNEECSIRNTQSSFVHIDVSSEMIVSDRRILGHVVRNMLVNALEGREENGGDCKLSCHDAEGGGVSITMENNGFIPKNIQKQMFKRYLSTKSPDRGLGVYVMKLMTEKFLDGKVTFSSENDLITFTIWIP